MMNNKRKTYSILLSLVVFCLLAFFITSFCFNEEDVDTVTGVYDSGNVVSVSQGYADIKLGDYYISGGEGGVVTFITKLEDLFAWAKSREDNESPEIVYLKGSFSAKDMEMVQITRSANISIIGLGEGAEFENIGFNITNSRNLIFQNLKIGKVLYPGDAFNISSSFHIWIDHCELFSDLSVTDAKNVYDGLLDINYGSSFITVSWTYFHDHFKTSLISSSDDFDLGYIDSASRITFRNNWFKDSFERNPSIRFGAVHIFNNYFENIHNYGLASRLNANALVENNYYYNVSQPMVDRNFLIDDSLPGFICQKDNIFTGDDFFDKRITTKEELPDNNCDFWDDNQIPYHYDLIDVSLIPEIIFNGAGVGRLEELFMIDGNGL